jgi:hypothetical protein
MGGSYSYSWTMNAIADKAGWAKFKEPFKTDRTTGKSSYGDLKMQFKNTGRYSDLSTIDEQSMTAYAKVRARTLHTKSHFCCPVTLIDHFLSISNLTQYKKPLLLSSHSD